MSEREEFEKWVEETEGAPPSPNFFDDMMYMVGVHQQWQARAALSQPAPASEPTRQPPIFGAFGRCIHCNEVLLNGHKCSPAFTGQIAKASESFPKHTPEGTWTDAKTFEENPKPSEPAEQHNAKVSGRPHHKTEKEESMATKLDEGQKHLLRLVMKGADAEGFAPVSKLVFPLVEKLPSELVELEAVGAQDWNDLLAYMASEHKKIINLGDQVKQLSSMVRQYETALIIKNEEHGCCAEDLIDARKDSERLDWLMRNVSGKEFRRLGVTYGGNCGRDRIDAAMKVSAGDTAKRRMECNDGHR